MKVRCRSRADRILRRLQGRLVEQLSQADQSVIDDRFQQMVAHRIWPPRQILLDVLNEIAIRFLGNGAPPRLYQHVIIWNTDREAHHRESRKFLELGRALQCAPKEMFDTRDWAIMLLWDEMPRGIPGLARWRAWSKVMSSRNTKISASTFPPFPCGTTVGASPRRWLRHFQPNRQLPRSKFPIYHGGTYTRLRLDSFSPWFRFARLGWIAAQIDLLSRFCKALFAQLRESPILGAKTQSAFHPHAPQTLSVVRVRNP
jgi:hypothetical protein